jgi:hypothetical protein
MDFYLFFCFAFLNSPSYETPKVVSNYFFLGLRQMHVTFAFLNSPSYETPKVVSNYFFLGLRQMHVTFVVLFTAPLGCF